MALLTKMKNQHQHSSTSSRLLLSNKLRRKDSNTSSRSDDDIETVKSSPSSSASEQSSTMSSTRPRSNSLSSAVTSSIQQPLITPVSASAAYPDKKSYEEALRRWTPSEDRTGAAAVQKSNSSKSLLKSALRQTSSQPQQVIAPSFGSNKKVDKKMFHEESMKLLYKLKKIDEQGTNDGVLRFLSYLPKTKPTSSYCY